MADHGQVEYATAQGNDFPRTRTCMSASFISRSIGQRHVVSIVLGLAIGGVAGQLAGGLCRVFLIATIVAFHGFLSGARMPSIVMVIVSSSCSALTSGG